MKSVKFVFGAAWVSRIMGSGVFSIDAAIRHVITWEERMEHLCGSLRVQAEVLA